MLSNYITFRYLNHGLYDSFLPRVTSNFGAFVRGPPHNMSALCVLRSKRLSSCGGERTAGGSQRQDPVTGPCRCCQHLARVLLKCGLWNASEGSKKKVRPFLFRSCVRSGGETPRLPPCWFLSVGYDTAPARVCLSTCPPITALWSAPNKSRYEWHILHELLHEHLSGSVHLPTLPCSLRLWNHALNFNVHTASRDVLYSCHGNWW